MNGFITGISGLDKFLADALVPGTLIVIAGHPGSGKTTLASTICASNAMRGHKCLYITFQEDREKLIRNMKRVGVELDKHVAEKNIVIVRLPASLSLDDTLEAINKLMLSTKPNIIVIDSINTVLAASEKSGEKRALLHNFFYSLASLTKGLSILVAEIPLYSESLNLSGLEFISDIVLVLKIEREHRLASRMLEIRKVRGAPVYVVEVPFSIIEGKGIYITLPPILEKISAEKGKIKLCCRQLESILNYMERGEVVYVTYPPDARPDEILILLAGLAVVNDHRVLLISYRSSPHSLRRRLIHALERLGAKGGVAEKIVEKHFVFKSLNPFIYTLSELVAMETTATEEVDADMIILHGVDIPMTVERLQRYMPLLFDQLNYFKEKGVLVVRLAALVDEKLYNINSRLSDIVMRYMVISKAAGRQEYKLYVWGRNRRPHVLMPQDIEECIRETIYNMLSVYA